MAKVFGMLDLSANNKGDFGAKPRGRRNLAGGVNRRTKMENAASS
jgi:hypothetical protein